MHHTNVLSLLEEYGLLKKSSSNGQIGENECGQVHSLREAFVKPEISDVDPKERRTRLGNSITLVLPRGLGRDFRPRPTNCPRCRRELIQSGGNLHVRPGIRRRFLKGFHINKLYCHFNLFRHFHPASEGQC